MDSNYDSDYACYGVCCWVDSIASDEGYLDDGQSECLCYEQYNEYVYKYRAVVGCGYHCCIDIGFYDHSEEF